MFMGSFIYPIIYGRKAYPHQCEVRMVWGAAKWSISFVRLVQDSSLRCFVLPIILYSERLDCYYYLLVDSVNIRTTTDMRNLFCLHTSNVWYYDGKRWEQKKNGEREREREIKRNNSQKQNPTKDWLVTLFVNVYRCLLLLCRHWWMLYYNLWYCITMQKLLILSATS